jgi:hypothetical protein
MGNNQPKNNQVIQEKPLEPKECFTEQDVIDAIQRKEKAIQIVNLSTLDISYYFHTNDKGFYKTRTRAK